MSRDGDFVALTSGGALSVWDIDRETELWREPPSVWRMFPLAFSPDGMSVANVEVQLGDGRRTAHIVFRKTRTGRIINTLDTECDQITGIRFTPSGTLCSWDYHGAIVGWDLARQCKAWHLSCRDYVSSADQSTAKSGREPGKSAG
jgi:hypothetical protein